MIDIRGDADPILEAPSDLPDADLVRRARAGDDRSLDALLRRYRSFARAKAHPYYLSGADREDVVQEALIGLFKAIRDYDDSQNTPFRAFAELCISRQIMTAIKTANRYKHVPLNCSISLDAAGPGGESEERITDLLMAPASDPAEMVIAAQEIETLCDSIRSNLTTLEGDVLNLYVSGNSYEEIAHLLGNQVKSIDNALQRVKRKLQTFLSQRDAVAW